LNLAAIATLVLLGAGCSQPPGTSEKTPSTVKENKLTASAPATVRPITPPPPPTVTAQPAAFSATEEEDVFPIDTIRESKDKSATGYDALYTMFAINAFTVSLSTVIAAEDRIVLDQEYQNVLHNLKIGNIEADKELQNLCGKHLETITKKTLREEERQRFLAAFERKKKQALFQAIGGIRAYGGDPYSFIFSLAQNTVSAYFNYANLKSEMHEELDSKLWELQKDEISDLNDIRTEFLKDAWTLLRRYKMQDDWLLTEKTANECLNAINDQDKARALRTFESIRDQFRAYPPFWFYYGLAAQQNQDLKLAIKCYNTFQAIYRDILRKDPHYARVCLNKALLLGKDGPKEKICSLLETTAKQSDASDGMNLLTVAMIYAQLGNNEKATRYLQSNIDNRTEVSFSRIALDNLQSGRPIHTGVAPLLALQAASSSAKNTLDGLTLEQIQELAEKGLPEAQYALACRLDGVEGTSDQQILDWLKKAAEQNYIDAQNMLARKFMDQRDYDQAYSWFEKSATQNDATGYWGLGVCHRDGGGKYADEKKSAEYFKKAADCGDPKAMYEFGLCSLEAKGVTRNLKDAFDWFTSAAQRGYVKAQCDLGQRLVDGAFVELEDENQGGGNKAAAEKENQKKERTAAQRKQGVTWLRKAAESGDSSSILAYWSSVHDVNGDSEKAEAAEYALTLAKQFADKGNDCLQFFLGKYYAQQGDKAQADAWLKRTVDTQKTFAAKALVTRYALNENWGDNKHVFICPHAEERAKATAVDVAVEVALRGIPIWDLLDKRNFTPVIDNVKGSYASLTDKDELLFIWDNTFRKNGSKGFCLTASSAFSSDLNDPKGISLKDVNKAEIRKTYSWLTVKQWATAWIYLDDRQFTECPSSISGEKVVEMIQGLVALAKAEAK